MQAHIAQVLKISHQIFYSLLLVFGFVFSGHWATAQKKYDPDKAKQYAKSHRTIAIDQPLMQVLNNRRLSPEEQEDMRLEYAQDAHMVMIDFLREELRPYNIRVLTYDQTFDRLEADPAFGSGTMSYEDMIRALQVDAILVSDYQLIQDRPNVGIFGGGGVGGISIGVGGGGINNFPNDNRSAAYFELFDGQMSQFIWSHELRYSNLSRSRDSIIKGISKKLLKKLPYEKRKRKRR